MVSPTTTGLWYVNSSSPCRTMPPLLMSLPMISIVGLRSGVASAGGALGEVRPNGAPGKKDGGGAGGVSKAGGRAAGRVGGGGVGVGAARAGGRVGRRAGR